MKNYTTFLLFALLSSSALAQSGIELGLIGSSSFYQGDVTESHFWEFKETSIGAGLFARFPINDTWNMRAGLSYIRIAGTDLDDADRDRRAFAFHNNMVEFSLVGEFEPMGSDRIAGNMPVSPYLVFGGGLLYTNPEVDFSRFTGDLLTRNVIRDRDTPYSKLRVIIPIGLGVKVPMGDSWLVGLEAAVRYPFTDYLDGISYSANPEKNDWYALIGLTLAKKL